MLARRAVPTVPFSEIKYKVKAVAMASYFMVDIVFVLVITRLLD
ncbi:MAG TPA: hypothetical protein VL996_00400 [Methylocella sp.]|nr:hypothetical protein [Methylocella sp.]